MPKHRPLLPVVASKRSLGALSASEDRRMGGTRWMLSQALAGGSRNDMLPPARGGSAAHPRGGRPAENILSRGIIEARDEQPREYVFLRREHPGKALHD